jgi:hypothetical protein
MSVSLFVVIEVLVSAIMGTAVTQLNQTNTNSQMSFMACLRVGKIPSKTATSTRV